MKQPDGTFLCERCGGIFEEDDMCPYDDYMLCNSCAYEYQCELSQAEQWG